MPLLGAASQPCQYEQLRVGEVLGAGSCIYVMRTTHDVVITEFQLRASRRTVAATTLHPVPATSIGRTLRRAYSWVLKDTSGRRQKRSKVRVVYSLRSPPLGQSIPKKTGENSILVGYARTSTTEQIAGLEAQLAALAATGCNEKIYREQVSSLQDRSQLKVALDFIRESALPVLRAWTA